MKDLKPTMSFKLENGYVTIPEKEYFLMLDAMLLLEALIAVGVTQWDGYKQAAQLLNEYKT